MYSTLEGARAWDPINLVPTVLIAGDNGENLDFYLLCNNQSCVKCINTFVSWYETIKNTSIRIVLHLIVFRKESNNFQKRRHRN